MLILTQICVDEELSMSKNAAIHFALCAQLASDNRDVPQLRTILGPNGLGLGDLDIRKLLAGVALRLRADTPSFVFKWSEMKDNLGTDTLLMIEERIADLTAPGEAGAPPPEPKSP